MAAWKLLGPGISLGTASTILLAFAMASERWYVLDATLYERFCPQQEVFEGLSPWQVHAYGGVKARWGNEALKPAPLKIRTRSGVDRGLKRSGRDLSGFFGGERTSSHSQEVLSGTVGKQNTVRQFEADSRGVLGRGGSHKKSGRDLSGYFGLKRTSRHSKEDSSGFLDESGTSILPQEGLSDAVTLRQFGAFSRDVYGRVGSYKKSGRYLSGSPDEKRTPRRLGANLRGASKRDRSSIRLRRDLSDSLGGIGSSRRSGAGLTPLGYREEFVDLPEAEKILRWRELMRDLATNLRSFGGRDITAQRRRSLKDEGENKAKSNMSTSNAGVQMTSCQRRQFTTATGLWRTCYLPEAGSLLAKLIDCGNLTRCMPVLYGVVDITAMPRSLFPNETSKIYQDEATLLNVRRTVASFLFLALVTQLSGVLVTSWGWFCNDGFEQYAGGLVMLMSGIFQLSCLCTHIIQCRIEMTRAPEDIYFLPSLVLHSYGAAVRAAWSAFVLSVLASFLCVMAPLHPAQNSNTPPRGKQVPAPTSSPAIDQPTSSTPASRHQSPMQTHPSNLVRVTPMRSVNQASPGAEGKPPTVAIEPWDADSRFEQMVQKIAKARTTPDEIDQEKGENDWTIQMDPLLRKQQSVELCRSATLSAEQNRANYYARTRSLPRQIAFTGETRPQTDNRRSSTIARCGKAEWRDRVVAPPHRIPRLTQEVGDQQKVMEIFRSAGIRQADEEDSDQEDVPALRIALNGRESVKTNFRLPCEQSASKFGTDIS